MTEFEKSFKDRHATVMATLLAVLIVSFCSLTFSLMTWLELLALVKAQQSAEATQLRDEADDWQITPYRQIQLEDDSQTYRLYRPGEETILVVRDPTGDWYHVPSNDAVVWAVDQRLEEMHQKREQTELLAEMKEFLLDQRRRREVGLGATP